MHTRSMLPLILVAFASCSHESQPSAASTQTSAKLPASLRLSAAPQPMLSVLDLRNTIADGADVVVTGRAKDFVATRAVFTIADMSLHSCADKGDKMDDCPTPWDYCCVEPKTLAEGTAAIEVHAGAEIAMGSAQGWNGLDHLKQVVVKGKLKKDAKGNLSVIADGIFVQP